MPRSVKLLLTDNVESLGIVGDVVNVRTGYARNFLLPRNLATQPSEEKIKALAAKRADAEKMLAELRKQREATSAKLQNVEITLIRSCNDQGHLYASITQQDIAGALTEQGYAVKPRDVRINQVMKRIDNYDVHVKLDSDLDAIIKVHVQADRKLDLERGAGESVPERAEKGAEKPGEESAEGEAPRSDRKERKPRPERPKVEERPEPVKGSFTKVVSKSAEPAAAAKSDKGEKPAKEKGEKPAKGDKSKAKA